VNEDLQQDLLKIQIFDNCSKDLAIDTLLDRQEKKHIFNIANYLG
jgi:hypothetical protein